jgi:hypothetical protein
MGSGLSELGEEGDFCVPVSGEGEDGNDPYFGRSKVTVNKFRLIRKLEDDPIIRSQAQVDKMKR